MALPSVELMRYQLDHDALLMFDTLTNNRTSLVVVCYELGLSEEIFGAKHLLTIALAQTITEYFVNILIYIQYCAP